METPLPTDVLHIDMDTFFVSCERLRDPSLVGKPVIVGGKSGRGVVSACSYETRPKGVRSGMPMRQASKLCPEATVISGNYADYRGYALRVRALIHATLPVVEFASIDECYCDFSGLDRFQGGWELARRLRQDIQDQTGLPLSMCLASSKTTAKIGTGQAKPNGELRIEPGSERAFLAPLPVGKIPGLGPKANQRLAQEGILTIGDIQQADPARLEAWLGSWGRVLWHKAHGTHRSRVHASWQRKQIGKETTFGEDSTDVRFLHATLHHLAEQVAARLRADGRYATSVTLKLRYHDFETLTHQCTLAPTQADHTLATTALKLFSERYRNGRPVRLVGVSVAGLVVGGTQLGLFEDREKRQQLAQTKDSLNAKLGKDLVRSAASLPPGKARH